MNYKTTPRGIRNNNPLNIRYNKNNNWIGKLLPDPEFEVFTTQWHGIRAAFVLLKNYMTKFKCDTIEKIITKWAPPSENNTEGYIAHVSNMVGIPRSYPLTFGGSPKYVMKILLAMAKMESGVDLEKWQVVNAYYAVLWGFISSITTAKRMEEMGIDPENI